MNTIQTLRKLKEINSKLSLEEPTFARLYLEDSLVFLDINGIAHVIEIYFDGYIFIEQPNTMFKYYYKNNKITIYNTFNKEINNMFSYSGTINIKNVVITTNTGRTLRANVSSNQNQAIINKQKTKVEDDTLIINYDTIPKEPTIPLAPFKEGIYRKSLSSNSFNEQGKFQRVEKMSTADMKSSIPDSGKAPRYTTKRAVKMRRKTAPVKRAVTTKIRKDVKGGKY